MSDARDLGAGLRDQPWVPLPRAGSRILVTGATGGLGAAVIDAFTAAGASCVGIDLAASETPHPVQILAADLTDQRSAAAAVEGAVELLGGLDAVVGAAGVTTTLHRASTFPGDVFSADIAANLHSQFFVAQAAYPALRESASAVVVFASSIAAVDGLPGQASYAAAKAGVLGLTRTLAAEWIRDGVRVNAVVPGLFATPKVVEMPESARARLLEGVPMGRVASLAEVIAAISYLLSPASGYMTGQYLRLDGGAGLNTSGLHR